MLGFATIFGRCRIELEIDASDFSLDFLSFLFHLELQSVWALCLSYRKFGDTDDARAKFQMLAGSATKTMRSLLMCMMRQSGKIERFKNTKATEDAIHAKFNVRTLSTVVGDHDWGHLQLDATGLFVLQLAQVNPCV